MEQEPVETDAAKEAQRQKISEGMKRSHERRRQLREKQLEPKKPKPDALLDRLIKERDALNVVIESLQQRGVK